MLCDILFVFWQIKLALRSEGGLAISSHRSQAVVALRWRQEGMRQGGQGLTPFGLRNKRGRKQLTAAPSLSGSSPYLMPWLLLITTALTDASHSFHSGPTQLPSSLHLPSALATAAQSKPNLREKPKTKQNKALNRKKKPENLKVKNLVGKL